MSTEDFIDSTLANLRVIGMVPKGGKLCIRKGHLCLDTRTPGGRLKPLIQPLARWIHGDSRDVILLQMKLTINGAIKVSKSLMADCNAGGVGQGQKQWTVDRIMQALIACETGLENMKGTYANDSMMLAQLDVIMDRQRCHCEEVASFLSKHERKQKN